MVLLEDYSTSIFSVIAASLVLLFGNIGKKALQEAFKYPYFDHNYVLVSHHPKWETRGWCCLDASFATKLCVIFRANDLDPAAKGIGT